MSRSNIEVLYEDNHLIAVNKKPSEIVQVDKTGDEPLFDKVKHYIKVQYNKPGDVFLGVIHRIDRPVSGIVIFAKTSKALERLNEMFKSREVQKTYWAVVKNRPSPPEQNLVHYLKRNQEKNLSKVFIKEVPDSQRCELSFKLISSIDNYHLLEVLPVTGRHHQIRVQLSSIGSPIKGDIKYGFPRTNKDASIHLHARKLEFIHPVKKEKITILAPPPDEVIWNAFLKATDQIKG